MDNPTGVHIPADKLLHISEGWFCSCCQNAIMRDPYNPNIITCSHSCTWVWEGELLPDHWITTRVYHMRDDEIMAKRTAAT